MNRNDNAVTQTLRRRCFEALLVGMFYVPYWILEQCSQLTSGISAIGFLFVLLVSTISTMFEAIMQIFSVFNKLFAVVLKTVSWVFKLLASVFNSQFFTRKFARSSLLGYLLSKMAYLWNNLDCGEDQLDSRRFKSGSDFGFIGGVFALADHRWSLSVDIPGFEVHLFLLLVALPSFSWTCLVSTLESKSQGWNCCWCSSCCWCCSWPSFSCCCHWPT